MNFEKDKDNPIMSQDSTKLAFAIFGLCLVTRALLQMFGGNDIGDVSWITTFGAIGAGWIGVGGQVESLRAKVKDVERNTNGVLAAKFEEVTEKAAHKAVEKAIANPAVPTGPESDPVETPPYEHPGVTGG